MAPIKRRRKWSDEDMTNALSAVKGGMSLGKAAKEGIWSSKTNNFG